MDFIILKVNGVDVSSFPHEDALRTFLTAQEPIVVEVKRRLLESPQDTECVPIPISTGCQTDLSTLTWIEDDSFDGLANDIDLEEVTLRKCNSDEKLGLTVCYNSSSEADSCTEVYIRDIAPQSVADRDGRLRQGDQILQVNGKDVASKEETESLFAENRKAVTLLISRCFNRSEEHLNDETASPQCVPQPDVVSPAGRSAAYQNSLIEQLIQQQAESQHHHHQFSGAPRIPQHLERLTNSLVRSKMDSICSEITELEQRMQNIQLLKGDKRKPPELPQIPAPPESDTEHIYETIPEIEEENEEGVLEAGDVKESKDVVVVVVDEAVGDEVAADDDDEEEIEPIYSFPYEADDGSIIDQWLKGQNWNNNNSNNINKNSNAEAVKDGSAKTKSPHSSGEDHENSSSAYNTGGSSNSNPLTFEIACSQDLRQKDIYRSTLILCPSDREQHHSGKERVENSHSNTRTVVAAKKKAKTPSKSPTSPPARSALPYHLTDTMYTNVANLQQTMLLQQQLFRQALVANGNDTKTSITSPTQYQFNATSHPHQLYTVQSPHSASLEPNMEWKVRRRSDGSRYIARRPVRNRILRNRAIKICEERAGLTTEDDSFSELKCGRYWTKDERKKHFEKSRERKQRQAILLASRKIDEGSELVTHQTADKVRPPKKGCSMTINNTVFPTKTADAKKPKTKRMHRDENFDTVQEMIAHGPKIPNSSSKIGLLSVTTV